MELTFTRANELFCYDPTTGHLTWRVSTNSRAPAGAKAGTLDPKGYLRVMVDGKRYQAHRIAWLLTNGEWPSSDLDHRNLDGTDNRIANLREASHSQNMANKKPFGGRLKGVSFERRTGRWRARIKSNRKEIALGHFDTAANAHAAYCAAAEQQFGEFARYA